MRDYHGVAEMVDCELDFVAVGAETAGLCHDAGIEDQDIETRVCEVCL